MYAARDRLITLMFVLAWPSELAAHSTAAMASDRAPTPAPSKTLSEYKGTPGATPTMPAPTKEQGQARAAYYEAQHANQRSAGVHVV
jgi:hypothetical protein